MVQAMKILEIPIIWMEQVPENLGPTTESVSRHLEGISPVEKFSFSCCNEPGFEKKFNRLGRNQVLLTGIETHICVFQTGRDLMARGCEVQVVADCVSSRTLENKKIGLERIVQEGGRVTCVEMILFELLKEARGDRFRKIVRLIK